MNISPWNLFALLSLMNLMLAVVMTYTWKVSARIAGTGFWAAGFAGISTGQMLLALSLLQPSQVSYIAAFILQLMGAEALFRGCAVFLELPAGWKTSAAVVLAAVASGTAALTFGTEPGALGHLHAVIGYSAFALVFIRTALLFLHRVSFVWGGVRYGSAAALSALSLLQLHRALEAALPAGALPGIPAPLYLGLFLLVYTGLALTLLQMGYAKYHEQLKAKNAEHELLLREMHHRTKNNLALVASLLSLESGRMGDPEARAVLDQLGDRVGAIALLHEQLQEAGASRSVRADEYIGRVAAAAAGAEKGPGRTIALERDIAPIDLSAADAIPLGLIVNELVTNAVKHAFQGRPEGRIRVSLTRRGECIVMTVSDDGAGMGGTRQHGSLGLTLVSSLAAQLRGDMRFENGKGTKAVITVPSACA